MPWICETCKVKDACMKSVVKKGPFAKPSCEGTRKQQRKPRLLQDKPPKDNRRIRLHDKLNDFLTTHTIFYQTEIQEATGWTHSGIHQRLLMLVNKGILTRTEQRQGKRLCYIYKRTENYNGR